MSLLTNLHFPGAGRLGMSAFLPALALLANQDYTKQLAHYLLPALPDVFVPLIGGLIVGFSGLLMLYAKSPAAPTFIPNGSTVTSSTEINTISQIP